MYWFVSFRMSLNYFQESMGNDSSLLFSRHLNHQKKKLNFYRWLFQICVHCRRAAVYFYPCGCRFVFSPDERVLFFKPYILIFLRILKKKQNNIISHSLQLSFLSNHCSEELQCACALSGNYFPKIETKFSWDKLNFKRFIEDKLFRRKSSLIIDFYIFLANLGKF